MNVLALLGKCGRNDTSGLTGTLTLTSPVAYEVIQRNGSNQAGIAISGTYILTVGSPSTITASWNGGTEQVIDASPSGGTFSGTLTAQTGGQGTLDVRFTGSQVADTADYVGVGDILAVLGQSNGSGRGTNNQTYSHATLKASLFGNDYAWKELVDPYDSNTDQVDATSSDSGAAGSWVHRLATNHMAVEGVPVAFIPCAVGGTAISQHEMGVKVGVTEGWDNRTEKFGSASWRIRRMQGENILGILWWQGESDNGTTEAVYQAALEGIADNHVARSGSAQVMPCILQELSGGAEAGMPALRLAVAAAIAANVNVVQGPDFSDTITDDSFHFIIDTKLDLAGDRWWTAIKAAWL